MLACKTPFDGTVEKVHSNVKVINGEKFLVSVENDYKLWERYDLLAPKAIVSMDEALIPELPQTVPLNITPAFI